MALNPRAMLRVRARLCPRAGLLPSCPIKMQRQLLYYFAENKIDFALSGWPSVPELHRHLHWPDDIGGGMAWYVQGENQKRGISRNQGEMPAAARRRRTRYSARLGVGRGKMLQTQFTYKRKMNEFIFLYM